MGNTKLSVNMPKSFLVQTNDLLYNSLSQEKTSFDKLAKILKSYGTTQISIIIDM